MFKEYIDGSEVIPVIGRKQSDKYNSSRRELIRCCDHHAIPGPLGIIYGEYVKCIYTKLENNVMNSWQLWPYVTGYYVHTHRWHNAYYRYNRTISRNGDSYIKKGRYWDTLMFFYPMRAIRNLYIKTVTFTVWFLCTNTVETILIRNTWFVVICVHIPHWC